MNFCPDCGARVAARPSADGFPRWHCTACCACHYEGPRVLVWCFAHWRGALLMCRRAEEPGKGLWNPPSGYVETGETLEAAAARELREETGVAVDPKDLGLFRVVSLPHLNQVFVGFHVELHEAPRPVAGPEATEVRMFREDDIPLGELAFREAIADEYPVDIFEAMRARRFVARSVSVSGAATVKGR